MIDRICERSTERIKQHYGNGHHGVDLGFFASEAHKDVNIYANCKGIVKEIVDGLGNNKNYGGAKSWGNYVYIKHDNGKYSRYAHLKKGSICVKKGQIVHENTMLGIMGDSGNAYGRHLHFEVSKGYSSLLRINPEPYLTLPICTNEISNYYIAYDNVKNKWLPKVNIGSNDYAGNIGNSISAIKIEGKRYRVHDKIKHRWLPYVNSLEDYAGNLPDDIDAIQIENATYQVHDKVKGYWLPLVSENIDYAGNFGNSIDGIRIKQ